MWVLDMKQNEMPLWLTNDFLYKMLFSLDDKAIHTHIEVGAVANILQEIKHWNQSTDFNADHWQ